jgi:hypothetical protein
VLAVTVITSRRPRNQAGQQPAAVPEPLRRPQESGIGSAQST